MTFIVSFSSIHLPPIKSLYGFAATFSAMVSSLTGWGTFLTAGYIPQRNTREKNVPLENVRLTASAQIIQ